MENRAASGAVKRTVSLSEEQARYVDEQVSSGGYSSASEVVGAGLRALQERDAATNRWLQDAVLHVYDAMQSEPARGLSAEMVAERLLAHHKARLSKGGDAG